MVRRKIHGVGGTGREAPGDSGRAANGRGRRETAAAAVSRWRTEVERATGTGSQGAMTHGIRFDVYGDAAGWWEWGGGAGMGRRRRSSGQVRASETAVRAGASQRPRVRPEAHKTVYMC